MFIMFVVLTIGQLIVEDKVVDWVNSWWPKMFTPAAYIDFKHWHANSNAPNLLFSIGLSFVLATMFPAAGLIVLASGLVSTGLSRPWAVAKMNLIATRRKFNQIKPNLIASWHNNKDPLVDLAHATMAFIRAITWPWRQYNRAKSWCSRTWARVQSMRLRRTA